MGKKKSKSIFKKSIVIDGYEGGGEIHLRRPKAQELNDFQKAAYPTGKKGLLKEDRDTVGARIVMFDALFEKIVNFELENGKIMPEDSKDLIPEDEKNHIIMTYVEAREGLDVKN